MRTMKFALVAALSCLACAVFANEQEKEEVVVVEETSVTEEVAVVEEANLTCADHGCGCNKPRK